MEPIVELCSAKVACKGLKWDAVGWIALVKYIDTAQANCAPAVASAMQNAHVYGYVFCRYGPPLQDIAAWLK